MMWWVRDFKEFLLNWKIFKKIFWTFSSFKELFTVYVLPRELGETTTTMFLLIQWWQH